MAQLGEDGSSRGRPPLFFKQQGTPECDTGFDGVIPGVNWPSVTAVSCRLCLPELVRTSCSGFVHLQMSPGKEIIQVGAALQESPRRAIQEGWDTWHREGCSAS